MTTQQRAFVLRIRVALTVNGLDGDKLVKVPEFSPIEEAIAEGKITTREFVQQCDKLNRETYFGALSLD